MTNEAPVTGELPVTANKLSEMTGYSVEAIRTKYKRNLWPEGLVWFKAPDGRVLFWPSGYKEWAKSRESN